MVDRALEVLEERRADLVAVGRGLIADPLWPCKLQEGRFEDIVMCQKCAMGICIWGFPSAVLNGPLNLTIRRLNLTLAAGVAVMEDGRILLTKREDFEVWCIPGGMVEDGESVAGAAVREIAEETGLTVELTGLVGVYSKLSVLGDVHSVIFRGARKAGELTTQAGETLEFGYFGVDDLPADTLYGQRQRILDALNGNKGIAVKQELSIPLDVAESRRELYKLRDQSRKSRRDFYMDLMAEHGPELNQREVG